MASSKVNSVCLWNSYIKDGDYVKNTTGFIFDVSKGEGGISRMVYDATICGLNNDVLWTPNFFLPTIDLILRNVGSDFFWLGRDIDLGEMFLKFWLDDVERAFLRSGGCDRVRQKGAESQNWSLRVCA